MVEAGCEVVALLGEEGEAIAVAFLMAGGGTGAVDLFLGVKDFEREDGQAVDHEAGALGMEFGGWVGKVCGPEGFE